MNNFEKLNNYINSKNKMLYTFCFYKISVSDIVVYLTNLLDKINSMKDNFKRKIANDRVYGFKSYLELMEPTQKINAVYLIDDNNKPIGFNLEKSQIQVLSDFKIPCSQYFCDDVYNIDYIQKLVSSTELVNVISVDGTSGKLIEIDSVKNKHHDSTSNLDTLISTNKTELIFGLPNSIQTLQKKYPDKQYFSGKLSNDQIWEQIIINTNLKTQGKLNTEVLTQMTNPDKIDLFVFGRKNVKEAILSYAVKKLFVTSDIFAKYKINIPTECFNFEVCVVDKITPGDYGDTLIKNFDGVIAIKYY
jgi:hypothetical protein